MPCRQERERSGSESGFTWIELLVVIGVLGILAAIALPAFFSERDKARDAEAKAAARTAQIAAEAIRTANDGDYDGTDGVTVANLRAIELTLNDAALTVPAVVATSYTVRVTSDSGNSFDLARNADGTTDLTCVTAGEGGCKSDGTWG